MGEAGGGDEIEHAFGHGEAGAQDRRDDQLSCRRRRRLVVATGRLDAHRVGGQIARHLRSSSKVAISRTTVRKSMDRTGPVAQMVTCAAPRVRDDPSDLH
jgi:hypothetical protein